MTRKLPGRTDNAIKNRYHAVIRLRLRPSSFFIELDDYNIDEFNLESITKVSNNGLKENTSSDDEYVINSLVHDLKNQHVVHPNPPKKKRSRAEDNENLFLALPNDSNGNSISRVKSTDSNPNSAACTPRLEQSPSNGEYFELLQKGIEAKRERDSTLLNRSKIHQADGEVKDSDYFNTYGSSELPDADKATAQILLGLLQSSNEIMC